KLNAVRQRHELHNLDRDVVGLAQIVLELPELEAIALAQLRCNAALGSKHLESEPARRVLEPRQQNVVETLGDLGGERWYPVSVDLADRRRAIEALRLEIDRRESRPVVVRAVSLQRVPLAVVGPDLGEPLVWLLANF